VVLSLILYATIGLSVVGAGLYLAGAYNQMVSSTREADRAFANVEVSLKQRHDELPPLVDICRGYMTHERDVLERVVQLRARFAAAESVDEKVLTENELWRGLSHLVARAEAYPGLKANRLFLRIADRLTRLEEEIADRRELFNASVTAFNTYVESFPAFLFAPFFGQRSRPLLKLDVGTQSRPISLSP
jgi:LemA protein